MVMVAVKNVFCTAMMLIFMIIRKYIFVLFSVNIEYNVGIKNVFDICEKSVLSDERRSCTVVVLKNVKRLFYLF